MKTLKPIEVFEYLKSEYNYICMDKTNAWKCFFTKPNLDLEEECWENDNDGYLVHLDGQYGEYIRALNINYEGDWKDSLFERPGQKEECLPEIQALQHQINDLLSSLDSLRKLSWNQQAEINKLKKEFSSLNSRLAELNQLWIANDLKKWQKEQTMPGQICPNCKFPKNQMDCFCPSLSEKKSPFTYEPYRQKPGLKDE